MDSDRKTARVAGAIIHNRDHRDPTQHWLLDPILNSSDYLLKIFANQDRVVVGASFELVAELSRLHAGIAISLYPVLRRHGEGLALGAVGFRMIEGMLYVVVTRSTNILLSTLSQQFVRAGAPPSSYFQNSGGIVACTS